MSIDDNSFSQAAKSRLIGSVKRPISFNIEFMRVPFQAFSKRSGSGAPALRGFASGTTAP